MSVNTIFLPPSQLSRIDVEEMVPQVMARSLSATLLRMLSEAPGYAQDIAHSLDLSLQEVERELEMLVSQGVVVQVKSSEGEWFRLAGRRVVSVVWSLVRSNNVTASK